MPPDDTYAPSPLPGAQPPPPAPVYAPSPLPETPAQISHAIIGHESGGRNVTSPQGAVGPGQIMPATFAHYALPGEDIHNPHDNLAVHNRIIADYTRRWPNDPARVAVAYFSGPGNVSPPGSPTPWIRNSRDVNQSVAQYVADTVGKAHTGGGGAPATTQPVAPPPTPPPTTVGGALAGLTGALPGGQQDQSNQGRGLFGNAADQPSAPPIDVQGQQAAAMGNARQQQIGVQAAQLMQALQEGSSKPLSWGTTPFGSGVAGPVMPVGGQGNG